MKAKLLFLVFFLGVSLQSLAQINITTQPVSPSPICEGGTLVLSVEATGTNLTYQWYHNVTAILSAATTSTLIISSAVANDSGTYYCIVSSSNSPSVTSVVVQVVVNSSITIQAQPVPLTMKCEGSALSLYVLATGTAITYQWFHDNSAISGATNAILNIASLTAADAGTYKCFISSPTCQSYTSSNAEVIVNELPTITSQPGSITVCEGQPISISIAATGTGLTYQWYHGGIAITSASNPSAQSATLTIAPATLMDNGNYTCQVTGVCAPDAITTDAQVIVNPLSVLENSRLDFSVYPNPASNTVTVQFSNASNTFATISVFDLQGKQVLQQEATIENNQSRVSIASLQSGMYLIKITTVDATVTKKLLVN